MDDPKESASSPTGTPTGRIKSDSLIDFMERWMGPTQTYLREPMAALENSPEIPVLAGADYAALEARTVAILVGHRGGKMFMKEILEKDFYQGLKPELVIIDEMVPEVSPEERPVKQNGRDASYLDLDPTKRHGKRRR